MATTNPIGGVFWRMVAAELRKLLSRPSGVVMLVISALLPILVFGLAKLVEGGGVNMNANGQPGSTRRRRSANEALMVWASSSSSSACCAPVTPRR